jgi:hypothetical protein
MLVKPYVLIFPPLRDSRLKEGKIENTVPWKILLCAGVPGFGLTPRLVFP